METYTHTLCTHIVGVDDELNHVLRVLIQDLNRGPGYERSEILCF